MSMRILTNRPRMVARWSPQWTAWVLPCVACLAWPATAAAQPSTAQRAQYSEMGDLFVWPYIRVRVDTRGTPSTGDDRVLEDTFVAISTFTPLYPSGGIQFKMYFVDGYIDDDCGANRPRNDLCVFKCRRTDDTCDPSPTPPNNFCCPQIVCPWTDRTILNCTSGIDCNHRSSYFSVFSGQGSPSSIARPFSYPPGAPGLPVMHPEGPGSTILRGEGYLIGWVVDSNDVPFGTGNQFLGSCTVVDYQRQAAWEYKPWRFRSNFTGPKPDEPSPAGLMRLNGAFNDYQTCPSFLLFDFWATGNLNAQYPGMPNPVMGALPLAAGGSPSDTDSELSLVSMAIDLRALPDLDLDGTPGEFDPAIAGPSQDWWTPTTTVGILTWNEMEMQISGTYRCLTCWDSTIASAYGNLGIMASPFAYATIQTAKGKGRIWSHRSTVCDVQANPNGDDIRVPYSKQSKSLPILGVAHQLITWSGTNGRTAKAGISLTAMGERTDGFIRFDP